MYTVSNDFPTTFLVQELPQQMMASTLANYSVPQNTILNCSQNFFYDEKYRSCVPICGEWKELPQQSVVAFATATSFLYALHLIGNIVALTLSCCNYKSMYICNW